MKDLIILNPRSNNGRSEKIFNKAVSLAEASLQERVKAAKMVKLAPDQRISELREIDEADRVFIFGGDGSVNSLVSAIIERGLNEKIKIGILPGGFGNGVAAMLGHAKKRDSIALFAEDTVDIPVDVIQTDLEECPYVLFSLGVGYDAELVEKRQKYLLLRALSYGAAFIESLLTSKRSKFYISLDGSPRFKLRAGQIMVANGPFYGMLQAAPKAVYDDGWMDVRIFDNKYKFLRNCLPRGIDLYPIKELSTFDARCSSLSLSGLSLVQIDGDPFHVESGKIELRMKKGKVRYLTLKP